MNAAPSYVLGVNSGPHDGAAALLRDGELVAMVEQERLSRNRRAIHEAPTDAIAACLSEAGIGLGDVSEVAVGWDVPALVAVEEVGEFDEREFSDWLFGDICPAGSRPPPLRYVEHHVAHAASAFYTSGFDEAAILVVDGRGEAVATTLAAGGPGGIEVIETWGSHLSLGHLYGSAAEWAGLTIWGAGKLMGLASYGKACQPTPLSRTARGYAIAGAPPGDTPVKAHLGELRTGLQARFARQNYPFCRAGSNDVMAYANFAASIQRSLEEVLLGLAELARMETGHRNLVLAGGVGLNCTANGVLVRSDLFDDVWIPPFPHDGGVSVGAALAIEHSRLPHPATRLDHAFWAPSSAAPDADALADLSQCEVSRSPETEIADTAAEHLAAGKLVGWWQGRAEVGQRALGARSILCDPRQRSGLIRANQVKGRESWRPLAPAVIDVRASELFGGRLPTVADFMLTAWNVRESAQPNLPAVVHVDGSARPQAVHAGQQRYYDLICAFEERTGTPAVINTSFNVAGEPIVQSAADAVRTFLASDLDVLVLENLIATKPTPANSSTTPKPAPPPPPYRSWAIPWIKR